MNLEQALQYARDVGLSDRQVAVVVRQEADRVRFRQDHGLVILVHPKLEGAEEAVHPDAVAQHELAGWVRKDTPKAEEKK
jgi:hypothetical protein